MASSSYNVPTNAQMNASEDIIYTLTKWTGGMRSLTGLGMPTTLTKDTHNRIEELSNCACYCCHDSLGLCPSKRPTGVDRTHAIPAHRPRILSPDECPKMRSEPIRDHACKPPEATT
jgi:hypothetical protein